MLQFPIFRRRSQALGNTAMNVFASRNDWQAIGSGQVRLDLHDRPAGLGLAWNFAGPTGFAVARRLVNWQVPPRFRMRFRWHGEGNLNRLEIKLIDHANNAMASVWWYQRDALPWPEPGTESVLESGDFAFAWGAAGGGLPARVAALEIAIVAGEGGSGELILESLSIEDLAVVQTCRFTEFRSGDGVYDRASAIGWSAHSAEDWLQLNWSEPISFAALRLEWAENAWPTHCSVTGFSATGAPEVLLDASTDTRRHFLYFGARRIQGLRLQGFREGTAIKLLALEWIPPERARSWTDFLHEVAAHLPQGSLPSYFSRRQCYWTVIGAPTCPFQALINEDGGIEVQRPGFSVDMQWLHDDSSLGIDVTSTLQSIGKMDAELSLADRRWPIPSVSVSSAPLQIVVTGAATFVGGRWCVLAEYRVQNTGEKRLSGKLLARLRPFQVTPPWQAWREFGGVFPVNDLCWNERFLQVNERFAVGPIEPVDACLLIPWLNFDDALLRDRLRMPCMKRITDPVSLAQAVMAWPISLASGESNSVHLLLPFERMEPEEQKQWWAKCQHEISFPSAFPAKLLDAAIRDWKALVGGFALAGNDEIKRRFDVICTATAHILVNRSGPALQPGPRRYARSWIRDAATMGAALLRMGRVQEVVEFLEWYHPFLREDGYVPCCVDRDGADPLVEHDSHGQWLFLVAEACRYGAGSVFSNRMLPSMRRVARYLFQLRSQRCTSAYQNGENVVRYGLLPESVSHEGYLAQPVHAYWDDVWAWRGLLHAVDYFTSEAPNSSEAHTLAERCRQESEALEQAIRNSMTMVMSSAKIEFLPGSVEWADYDPASTACAVGQLNAFACLPESAIPATFRQFLDGWRERKLQGRESGKYSAYDIRVVAALLRLGWRDEANELLNFLLADMRPQNWQQWPEISWPNPRSPGHLGDLPHSWIGAEAVLAILSLFVLEDERALVLGQGIKLDWLEEGVSGTGWPTPFGTLDFAYQKVSNGCIRVTLAGSVVPPDGIVLALPGISEKTHYQLLSGNLRPSTGGRLCLQSSPAELLFTC
ncbi:conserved hypothetical protein [gamma proteobacterium HdN1]|nr:conserved hypothetical protein [gamma proteobacterium HdN1]